jgi:hypothetical protein
MNHVSDLVAGHPPACDRVFRSASQAWLIPVGVIAAIRSVHPTLARLILARIAQPPEAAWVQGGHETRERAGASSSESATRGILSLSRA